MDLYTVRDLICTDDTFINDAKKLIYIRQIFLTSIAVEIKSSAISHIYYQFGIPFVIVRAISDIADKEFHLSFEEFFTVSARQSSTIMQTILANLTNSSLS